MALFESSLFHRLRNSLGNVVTYTYCGKGVLRRKPLTIHNPKTPEQQQARLRFKAAARLSAYFREAAPLGFPAPYAVQSHNAFVRANFHIFDVDENMQVRPDFHRLACSQGKLQPPSLTIEVSGRDFTVNIHEQKISAYCSRTDTIYAILWDCQRPDIRVIQVGKRMGDYTVPLSCPDKSNPNHLFIYAFAVSTNGKQASETLLLFAGEQ